jgi:hypothetical protein
MGSSAESWLRQPPTFDPATRCLTVGDHSAIVPDVPDSNEAMLRGYLSVVAQARGTAVASLTEVRQHDVAVLAQLLDLEDEDLEARFIRLLGMTPAMAADTRRRIAMHRAVLAAAGIAVGMFTSQGVASGSSAGVGHTVAPVVVSVAAAASAHVDAVVPAVEPAPPPGETEIGDAMVIERGTPPDDPNVEIGDAVTYER